MTAHTAEISAELPCHRCGYDLRAHPQDGKCPECGESVAESRRLAAIPRRPAWQESDPRWRRRMLAGIWILVLLPLMDVLRAFEWAASLTVPNVFGFPGALRLDETFLYNGYVYQTLIFCMGVVLLFSKERGRRSNQLDWTRRWGVICSYITLLLSAAELFFICALVLTAIGALFLSMPLKYQPSVTRLFAETGAAYLRYGPDPHAITGVVVVAFSSIAILLACIPLFDALRSSGPQRRAAILLAPLALFALIHLAQVGWYCLGFSSMTPQELYLLEVYFRPEVFVEYIVGVLRYRNMSIYGYLYGSELGASIVEATKWCSIVAIAIWLSIAQFKAWRQGKKASAA